MSETRRLVTIVLAVIAAALVLAVVVKYWPPEVERWVMDAAGRLLDAVAGTWRRVGGRWLTLVAVGVGVASGLALLRRRRWAGLLIIEVSVVGGAVVALVQPAGW